MAPSSCAACGAAATSQHPLRDCRSCRRVAYCDRACHKSHWKTHKPLCLELRQGWKDEDGNIMLKGEVHAPGTYVEYFQGPTPEFPEGHGEVVTLGPEVVVAMANKSEEERRELENMIVEGLKTKILTPEWSAKQQKKRSNRGDAEQVKPNSTEHQNALHTLAARYKADKEKAEQKIPSAGPESGKFVRIDEEENMIMLDAKGKEFTVPADSYIMAYLPPSAELPHGYEEIVRFDPEHVANIKHMGDDEKQAYKGMLGRQTLTERYAGLTNAEVIARINHQRTSMAALTIEVEAKMAAKTAATEN